MTFYKEKEYRTMAAYIDHAAYQVRDLDWCRRFFHEVFGMEEEKSRVSADGLGQVWFRGGVQLCESRETAVCGQAHHLSLIVDDLEAARRRALEWGCEADSRPNWLRMPEGLWLELFQAREGAVSALLDLPRREN